MSSKQYSGMKEVDPICNRRKLYTYLNEKKVGQIKTNKNNCTLMFKLAE